MVLCRPDVSHLSGSLGKGKGYKYGAPDGASFDESPGLLKGVEGPTEDFDPFGDGAGDFPEVLSPGPDAGNFHG